VVVGAARPVAAVLVLPAFAGWAEDVAADGAAVVFALGDEVVWL